MLNGNSNKVLSDSTCISAHVVACVTHGGKVHLDQPLYVTWSPELLVTIWLENKAWRQDKVILCIHEQI